MKSEGTQFSHKIVRGRALGSLWALKFQCWVLHKCALVWGVSITFSWFWKGSVIPAIGYSINWLSRKLKLWDEGLEISYASINMIWCSMVYEKSELKLTIRLQVLRGTGNSVRTDIGGEEIFILGSHLNFMANYVISMIVNKKHW